MKTTDDAHTHGGLVAILSAVEIESAEICQMIEEEKWRTVICNDLEELKKILSDPCLAAILDIDSVPLDNRTIGKLTRAYPGTCFFCTSKERFHPDLQDAISHHLFACLHKPIDPDELNYFLTCILNEGVESRGPPTGES